MTGPDAIPAGCRVVVDTAPIIYVLENHPQMADRFRWFFEGVDDGRYECFVSTVTLAEVLVAPWSAGNEELASRYRRALVDAPGVTVVPLSVEIADTAAQMRARYKLKLPDAIQLATAVDQRAPFLLTADRDFRGVREVAIIS